MAHHHYRPDIDGLRAIAVLAVVLHHLSAPLLPGGYVGVDVFFVISGYLITSIISREMAEGRFSFASFYERRARRIFPALFAMLAATLVASYTLLLPSDMMSTLRAALGTVFFGSNIVFWREMKEGYFAATDLALNPLLHTWSLSVEEQFYVFFPVLLLLCYRFTRQQVVPVLLFSAMVSLVGAALLVSSKSVAVFFLSPFRAWELLAGSLLALHTVPPLRSRMLRELIAAAGLLAIVVACFVYDGGTTFPGLAALAPVLGTAALIHAGASGPSLAARLLQLPPMVWVGLISYSLYLWHWPLIVLTRYATGFEPITPHIPMLFVASLVLAYLSYRFIEQPFRRSAGVNRRTVFVSSATSAVLAALVASAGLLKGGFESRFSPAVVALDKERTPQVLFQHCERKPPGAWCVLGRQDAAPQTLLWGDSHMLAWTPAFDQILSERGESAVFTYMSACPPTLGIHSHSNRPDCSEHNNRAMDYLLANPAITTVVMAGFWSHYFRSEGPLSLVREGSAIDGVAAAQISLSHTLAWLRNAGRRVVLIGPVPVYDKSVPLALAVGVATQRQLLHSTLADQMRKNAPFFEVVDALDASPSLTFLNPIQWFCANHECITTIENNSLYRDAHHLNVNGALAFSHLLAQGLTSPKPQSTSDPIAVTLPVQ